MIKKSQYQTGEFNSDKQPASKLVRSKTALPMKRPKSSTNIQAATTSSTSKSFTAAVMQQQANSSPQSRPVTSRVPTVASSAFLAASFAAPLLRSRPATTATTLTATTTTAPSHVAKLSHHHQDLVQGNQLPDDQLNLMTFKQVERIIDQIKNASNAGGGANRNENVSFFKSCALENSRNQKKSQPLKNEMIRNKSMASLIGNQ